MSDRQKELEEELKYILTMLHNEEGAYLVSIEKQYPVEIGTIDKDTGVVGYKASEDMYIKLHLKRRKQ